MRFFALVSLLPFLQIAAATFGHDHGHGGGQPPVYCGTTTITKSSCETVTSKAPAVTKTFTKDKQLCFTTEYKDKVATVTSKVKVTETITNHPTEYKTKWADAYTTTKTKTEVKETCSAGNGGGYHKRSLDLEIEQDEFDDEEYLTNAERIRRGLPLNKPVEKRTWGHGNPPPAHGPSCVPSTTVVKDHSTKTKTVTPTQWTTTTKCRYTQTIDIPKFTTTTVLKTKTITDTVQGKPTIIKTTLTPTSTAFKTVTKTTITGKCHPTYH